MNDELDSAPDVDDDIELLHTQPLLDDELYDVLKVYDQPAAAGYGNYLDDAGYEEMRFPLGTVPQNADFGVRISGDSMEPLIPHGSIAFVYALPIIENGQIGIFVMNGESYCKRIAIDESKREVRLESENNDYPDIHIGENDEVRTVGEVVGYYEGKA